MTSTDLILLILAITFWPATLTLLGVWIVGTILYHLGSWVHDHWVCFRINYLGRKS